MINASKLMIRMNLLWLINDDYFLESTFMSRGDNNAPKAAPNGTDPWSMPYMVDSMDPGPKPADNTLLGSALKSTMIHP